MSGAARHAASPSALDGELAKLQRRASRLGFFEIVQHLERLLPSKARVGGRGPLAEEAIRFAHSVEPVFQPSDVRAMRTRKGARGDVLVELTTTFLGIVGARSPLGHSATDAVLRAEGDDDRSLRAFYDLFHHRLVSLLYRAIVRATPGASASMEGDDAFTRRVLALAGAPERADATPVTRRALVGRARLLMTRSRGREAVEAMLALALPGVGVRLVEFVARDVPLSGSQRTALGRPSARFGHSYTLGARMPSQPGRVRLEIGPVSARERDSLQPGGELFDRVRAAATLATGGLLDVELDVLLGPDAEPGYRFKAGEGGALGATTAFGRKRAAEKPPLRLRFSLSSSAEGRQRPRVVEDAERARGR